MTLNDGFEMIPLPVTDKDRIITNMKEGKSPKYTGDSKLYVGNISFESSEADLVALFAEVGQVGSVALVRDEQGRNRGFGFVTMRTKEDGEAAMEKLNGMELNGRNLAVRESNN
jgi:RNA recognition motif-containing protein